MDDRRKAMNSLFDGLRDAGLGDREAAVIAVSLIRRIEPLLAEKQKQYQQMRAVTEHLLGVWPVRQRSPELDEARRYLREHCARCGSPTAHRIGAEILCANCV